MAPSVHVLIVGDLLCPLGFRRNDGGGAAPVQLRAPPIGIEGFVDRKGIEVSLLDQWIDADCVMALKTGRSP